MSKGADIEFNLEGDIFEALKDIRKELNDIKSVVGGVEDAVDNGFKGWKESFKKNWATITTGLNQGFELVEQFSSKLDFTGDVKNLQVTIQRFTDVTGADLEVLTGKVFRLQEVYGGAGDEIIRAANSMTKNWGGSVQSNLDIIEEGYQRGSDLNGDMLHQLNEYSVQLKQSGLNARESLAIMAQASKEGVYDDKAIDAIKEAGLSIREMGKAQVDALNGIGIKQSDVVGKTTMEVVQMVSKAMQTADTQAKQLALADIFKGAGEDAGLGFIEGLADMDLSLDKIPAVKQTGEDLNTFFADIKSTITSTLGDVTPYLRPLGEVAFTVSALLPILNSLAIGTKLITAAQWLWNAAMTANPIGLIIVGIGALIGAIAWMTDGFSGFGEFFTGFWDGLTQGFMDIVNFWNTYLNPFNWMIELIDYFFPGAKKAIFEFFSDLWDGVYDIFIKPLVDAWEWITDALGFGDDTEVKVKVSKDGTVSSEKTPVEEPDPKPETTPKGAGAMITPNTKITASPKSSTTSEKKEIKSISVNIQNLMSGDIVIKSENMKESVSKLRQMVNEALVGAVRDFEVAM